MSDSPGGNRPEEPGGSDRAERPADSDPGRSGRSVGSNRAAQPVTETDPARRALSAAKAAAGRRATTRTNRPTRRRVAGEGPTGSGPDDRDPQPLGPLVRGLFTERGWNPTASAAGVMERWPALVGPEVASHARPVSLRDGELVVEATSTAWATQLRLLTPRILAALARDVGPSVVTRMRVNGPAGPSWRRGPLRVTGPGPRDTYG